jgi:hypothetical protein
MALEAAMAALRNDDAVRAGIPLFLLIRKKAMDEQERLWLEGELTRIARERAETQKLYDEGRKLDAERAKLDTERAKLVKESWWFPWLPLIVALTTSNAIGVAAGVILARYLK